jgi:hypothetical protein
MPQYYTNLKKKYGVESGSPLDTAGNLVGTVADLPGDIAEGALDVGNKAVSGLVGAIKDSPGTTWNWLSKTPSQSHPSVASVSSYPSSPVESDPSVNQRADDIMGDSVRNTAAPQSNSPVGYPSQMSAAIPQAAVSGLMKAQPVSPEDTSSALAGFRARQGDDPNLKWHAMKEAEKSDIETGLTNPFIMNNPAKVASLRTQLGQVEGDLNDPTDFINRMRAMSMGTESAQHVAGLSGFPSPQAGAAYQRQMEQEKTRMPLEVAKTTGEYGLKEAQERGRSAAEVANITQGGKYDLIQSMLQGSGGGLPPGLSHISLPGGGGITAARQSQIPTQLEENVQVARTALANGRGNQATLDQAIANALSRHPADQALKQFAHDVTSDPRTANLPMEQILIDTGQTDLTPQEKNDFYTLLSIIRGK